MNDFRYYYSGEKVAPYPTLFIGGNHEASAYLAELPFGGWVAPRMYYMGRVGVVSYKGIRISGISGIYDQRDYRSPREEVYPYPKHQRKSVYHIRESDIAPLFDLSTPIDIMMTHDWPRNISKSGNEVGLLRVKPFFRRDIESGKLGSPASEALLSQLTPTYWLSAHMHCYFPATVHHPDQTTQFIGLDKVLPRRRYLEVIHLPAREYAAEWMLEGSFLSLLFPSYNGPSIPITPTFQATAPDYRNYDVEEDHHPYGQHATYTQTLLQRVGEK